MKFELTLVIKRDESPSFTGLSIDKVEGEDLVEVLSKFLILIAQLQQKWEQELITELELRNDDIPF